LHMSDASIPNYQAAPPVSQTSVVATYKNHESEFASANPTPDELLNIFRQNLAWQVPFVLIPPGMNAQRLSEDRPFLYQAIVFAASYHDSLHQLELGQQFIKDVTEHLVILGEKSLDLLQGLLVHTSWFVVPA
jgi:hypothetical protein